MLMFFFHLIKIIERWGIWFKKRKPYHFKLLQKLIIQELVLNEKLEVMKSVEECWPGVYSRNPHPTLFLRTWT